MVQQSHPMAYAAAPMATTYAAAPQMVMSAPGATYAAAPQMVMSAPPMQTPALQPMVDPQTIQQQKEQHAKGLEVQLKTGAETLGMTHKRQIDMLHAASTQQKQQYDLHLDQKVKEQELAMSQQYNQALMQLQQAAQAQRAELEQQAARLTLEYQQRRTTDEFASHKAQLEKQSYEQQARLSAEMARIGGQPMAVPMSAPITAAYAAPPTMMHPGTSFAPPTAYSAMPAYAAPPTMIHAGGSYAPQPVYAAYR